MKHVRFSLDLNLGLSLSQSGACCKEQMFRNCSIREQASVDRLSVVTYRSDIVEKLMTRSAISRSTVLVAGFVALVYASLAVMAASCAMSHVDPSSGHAHHGSQESAPRNALCAWACQTTTDAGLVPEPPALSPGPVVRLLVSSLSQVAPSHSSSLLRSRAPPSVRFVLIG
jgi:hypothetical protein